ncbi:MAG: sugar phosphate nucleotidyltransferase [Rubricoccaceae bacterium]|nr:sugar phosphate nucleotidyltransferase [Rubricoccaceae bacterium]
MKLIIPMAGRGTRLRPHTHVTPKPLLPVAGKTMVERIVETFTQVLPRALDEAVFVLGPDFGDEVRAQLTTICGKFGIEGHFAVQNKALGTAHAVIQAADHMSGECVIVFADTLFYMDAAPNLDADAVIWVKHVDDPSRFGVVVKEGESITAFVEKPSEPISNEAIIGIYYIREGQTLRKSIDYLIDNMVTGIGDEYQLTDALDRMLKEDLEFKTAAVSEWLDCGTIPALMETSGIVLAKDGEHEKQGDLSDTIIHEPVYIGEGAVVRSSEIGPDVAIESGAHVENSTLQRCIVFGDATVRDSTLEGSLVGHHADVQGFTGTLNIGDHSSVG